MGTPVTIDSDDLQVLLFCTGGVKQIEQSIKSWGTDPLKMQYGQQFQEVHDRVAGQMRVEQRKEREDLSHMHTPATPSELGHLHGLFKQHGGIRIKQDMGEPLVATPYSKNFVVNQDDYKEDRMRGFVEIGTLTHRIEWGDSKWENLSGMKMMGRLTKRALRELFPIYTAAGSMEE